MATRIRRDCAQLILRMEPAERDRIRAVIPHGSLNSFAKGLLLQHVETVQPTESDPDSPHPGLPLENTAA